MSTRLQGIALYHLAQAHLTRLRHQTQRATLARDSHRAWPHKAVRPRPSLPRITRKVLTTLATRSTQTRQ